VDTLARTRHHLPEAALSYREALLNGSSPRLLGDEEELKAAVSNLVDNAVKYSRTGGTVEISLTTHLNQAKLVITDQGIGISPEDQKRIFDRFYRTDDARAHTKKGTGLGLAICAWIVESHHGRIEVQSALNKGSTFTVTLPLAAPSS